MKIPKKILLNGETIRVKFNDKKCRKEGAAGLSRFLQNEILLCRRYHKKPNAKEHIEKTFIHEYIHFVLDKGGFTGLITDEKLVSCISNGIMELIKQCTY